MTKNFLIGPCEWHENVRKEAEFSTYVEEIDERCWYWRANIISWSLLLRMHSTGKSLDNTTKRLNPVFLLEQPKNTRTGQTSRKNFSAVLQDMLENAWNGIANWQTRRQSNFSRFLVFAWTITRSSKKIWKIKVNPQKFAPILYLSACTWHELVDLTFCGQSTNWHDLSENGLNHVTDDWHD